MEELMGYNAHPEKANDGETITVEEGKLLVAYTLKPMISTCSISGCNNNHGLNLKDDKISIFKGIILRRILLFVFNKIKKMEVAN